MKKIFSIAALLTLTFILSGCVTSLDGKLHPGNPFVHNKLARRYENRSVEQIKAATREVLNHNGTFVGENEKKSLVIGKVDQRDVFVKITPVNEKVSEVVIQVLTRANVGDIQLASEIIEQITLRLAAAK